MGGLIDGYTHTLLGIEMVKSKINLLIFLQLVLRQLFCKPCPYAIG